MRIRKMLSLCLLSSVSLLALSGCHHEHHDHYPPPPDHDHDHPGPPPPPPDNR